MRTRHLLTAIAALSVVALLSGCTPAKLYDKTATSTSSPTPVFASEEEALAAAEEVYARYLEVSSRIMASGGADAEQIKEVTTGEFLQASLQGFREVQMSAYRGEGKVEVRDIRIQSYFQGGGPGFLSVYACEDVSMTDVVDAQGVSVVSPTRPATTIFQTTFDLEGGQLLISSHESWRNAPC